MFEQGAGVTSPRRSGGLIEDRSNGLESFALCTVIVAASGGEDDGEEIA